MCVHVYSHRDAFLSLEFSQFVNCSCVQNLDKVTCYIFVQHGFIRILLSKWKNGFIWWSGLLQVREELRNKESYSPSEP